MSKWYWVLVPNFLNRKIISTNSVPTFGVLGNGSLPVFTFIYQYCNRYFRYQCRFGIG
ncbi:hypothetical protein HanRHA438_Chr04g0187251 [Helianthus annuus]|nr:hypothetical protein HanRHA438_Chr04g0187251 [Helianthus annuus]